MALKPFHVVLMITAIVMGFTVGYWGLSRYQETQQMVDLQTGLGSVGLSVALIGYLIWFLRKMNKKGW